MVNDVMATKPDQPTGLTAKRGDRSVTLTWLAPYNNGASPILGYQYHVKAESGSYGNWMKIPNSGVDEANANKYKVSTNLTNGTRYTFQVRAVNNVDESDWSNEASAIPAPVSPPTRPRSVNAGAGDGRIILQWATPEDDGNEPITSYEFRERWPDPGEWETIPGDGETRGHTVTGLTNGVFHGFYVRARNEEGSSPQVNIAGTPYAGAPGAPLNFDVETHSGRQIKLSWNRPTVGSGFTITGYYLIRSEDGVTAKHGGSVLAPGLSEMITGTSSKPVTRCYRIRTFFESSGGDRGSSIYSPEECASTTGNPDDETLLVEVYSARAKEGVDATIDFQVAMTRTAESQVQVRYFTQDVTAKDDEHYQSRSGTVMFQPGQRLKTVSVELINDLDDDPYKLFTLRIHNVTGADAEIGLAVARDTITNIETYPLAGFLLVDAKTQTALTMLTHEEEASVTLDDPSGGEFAFRAVSPPDAEIGSVRLDLTGARTASRTLNTEPWSLYGDDGGDLQGEFLPAGDYTLTATVYPEADLGGEVEQTLSVSFTVTAADNNPATGAPAVSGTAEVGETLTADVSGIADEDGLDDAVFDYQWTRNDGSHDADIQEATGFTYTLSEDDEGKTIRVTVSFTDDAGNPESLTSAATAAVMAAASSNDIEEPPSAPQNLLATENDDGSVTLTWDGPDDDSITGYQVLRRGPGEEALSVYEENTGSTATSFTDTGTSPGGRYSYRVKAINAAGVGQKSLRVVITTSVSEVVNTPATGAPTISDTAQAGETLTADPSGIGDADGLENALFSYQWISDDGSADADIQDATGSTHTLSDDDVGKTITVEVSFTDDGGNPETLVSAPTATVAAANNPATGLPSISGIARVG